MANCPSCNSKLPFFRVGFLSKINNKVRCKSCDKVLKGDESFASSAGLLGVSLFMIILNIWRDEIFENLFVFFAVLIVSMIIFLSIAFFQYKHIDIEVAHDQDQVLEYEQFKKKQSPPKLSENPTFVDKLKRKHFHKTDEQLLRIMNNPNMVDEAHQAARELLNEREKSSKTDT